MQQEHSSVSLNQPEFPFLDSISKPYPAIGDEILRILRLYYETLPDFERSTRFARKTPHLMLFWRAITRIYWSNPHLQWRKTSEKDTENGFSQAIKTEPQFSFVVFQFHFRCIPIPFRRTVRTLGYVSPPAMRPNYLNPRFPLRNWILTISVDTFYTLFYLCPYINPHSDRQQR